MEDVLSKIFVSLAVAAITALAGWFGTQIVKYKKLIKKEEDETVKKTIVNTLTSELEPIKTDISNIKADIVNMKNDIGGLQTFETNFSTRLQPVQEEIEHLKDDITEILDSLKQQGIDLQNIKEKEDTLENETRCAWRYRIRQLCHAYLARGWISHGEYGQLQEMFTLYTAIGGNGQTKELYTKTINLDMKSDAEAEELLSKEREKSCPKNCDIK